jgi:hypothetical protein
MTDTLNLLSLTSNGNELLEALEYMALDESQEWEALDESTNQN